MKKAFTSMTAAACAAALLAGCAADGTSTLTPQQKAALIGAGVGAVAGGVVGNQRDNRSDKTRATGALLGAAAGAGIGYLWSNQMEKQKAAMQQATAGTPVQVSQTADNRLKISIPADAGFATGSAMLNRNIYPILDKLAQTLSPTATVAITGHTDNTGSAAVNNPLSQNRADAAKNYLVSRGVGTTRISTSGAGSSQPIADNGTPAGRAQNRRVEIYVAEQAVVR